MHVIKWLVAGYITAVACVFVPATLKAQSASPDTTCAVSNGVLRVTPGAMSDVREVTVIRPDGGVVYIYSPQLGVYNLASPSRGIIEVNPLSQFGSQYAEDGKLHSRRIFSDTGSYRLVVLGKTTKTLPGVQYSRSGCALDFDQNQGFKATKALSDIAKEPLSSSLSCPAGKQPTLYALCRASGGCESQGNGYCCSADGAGGPCYCDNCCVAIAPAENK